MKKFFKIVGIVLLTGVIVQTNQLFGSRGSELVEAIGNFVSIFAFVAGIVAVVKVAKGTL